MTLYSPCLRETLFWIESNFEAFPTSVSSLGIIFYPYLCCYTHDKLWYHFHYLLCLLYVFSLCFHTDCLKQFKRLRSHFKLIFSFASKIILLLSTPAHILCYRYHKFYLLCCVLYCLDLWFLCFDLKTFWGRNKSNLCYLITSLQGLIIVEIFIFSRELYVMWF